MKGQITPYLEQITVNGSSISDCSTIAFGTNSSVNLSLKLRVTKSTTNDAKTGLNLQHESCLVIAKDKNKTGGIGLSKPKNPLAKPSTQTEENASN